MNVPLLPTINALLNLLAGLFLLSGWLAVKRGDKELHRKLMIGALVSSALFLISYVTYHAMMHGVVTKYQSTGIKRFLYFTILLTHTPLATLIVPFSLVATYHALKGNFEKHVKITRWLLPVWIYVSVTGVLIYVMLYVIN